MKGLRRNEKGALELDELGKLILGLIVLLVLIGIVTIYIRGSLDREAESAAGIFDLFN